MTDTWNPSSRIAIGGAGMVAHGPWASTSDAIHTPNGSGVRIVHGDSDWIQLPAGHAAATRILGQFFGGAADCSFWTNGSPANGKPSVTYAAATLGARASGVASGFVGGVTLLMPLRVHHGATLSLLDFGVSIGDPHSGGRPLSQPQFRAFKQDTFGNITTLCTSTTATGWAGNGYVQMQAASSAAYYNGGENQSITYPLDAGIVIDTTRYVYYAQVIDEAGANAAPGNVYTGVLLEFTSIPSLRPQ